MGPETVRRAERSGSLLRGILQPRTGQLITGQFTGQLSAKGGFRRLRKFNNLSATLWPAVILAARLCRKGKKNFHTVGRICPRAASEFNILNICSESCSLYTGCRWPAQVVVRNIEQIFYTWDMPGFAAVLSLVLR